MYHGQSLEAKGSSIVVELTMKLDSEEKLQKLNYYEKHCNFHCWYLYFHLPERSIPFPLVPGEFFLLLEFLFGFQA